MRPWFLSTKTTIRKMNNNSSKKKFNFHRKQQEMCLKRVFLGTSCLKVVIAVALICIQFKFPFVSAVTQYFFFLDLKCLVFSIISTAIYFRLSSFATITNISYWFFLLFWGSWDKWREIKTVAFVKTMSWAMALAVLADEEQGQARGSGQKCANHLFPSYFPGLSGEFRMSC